MTKKDSTMTTSKKDQVYQRFFTFFTVLFLICGVGVYIVNEYAWYLEQIFGISPEDEEAGDKLYFSLMAVFLFPLLLMCIALPICALIDVFKKRFCIQQFIAIAYSAFLIGIVLGNK